MRGLMFALLLLMVCVVVVGFYRGWFGLTTDGAGGQHRITLTVDEDKIKADEKRAKEQLPSIGQTTKPAEPKRD